MENAPGSMHNIHVVLDNIVKKSPRMHHGPRNGMQASMASTGTVFDATAEKESEIDPHPVYSTSAESLGSSSEYIILKVSRSSS